MQNRRSSNTTLVAALAGAAATFLATHAAAPVASAPALQDLDDRAAIASAPIRSAPVDEAQIAALAADAPTWLSLDAGTLLRDVPCMSAGEDAAFRLAHVMARDPAAYRGIESGASQVGQAIVLQTFEATPYRASGPGRLPDHVVRVDDGYFLAGAQRESLVAARGDDGVWTYGIVEPGGDVRSSGSAIKFCLRCHASAPHGGVFGLDHVATDR